MCTSLTPTSLGVAMSSWLLIHVTVTLLGHVRYMMYSIVGGTSVEKTNNKPGVILHCVLNYSLAILHL